MNCSGKARESRRRDAKGFKGVDELFDLRDLIAQIPEMIIQVEVALKCTTKRIDVRVIGGASRLAVSELDFCSSFYCKADFLLRKLLW